MGGDSPCWPTVPMPMMSDVSCITTDVFLNFPGGLPMFIRGLQSSFSPLQYKVDKLTYPAVALPS